MAVGSGVNIDDISLFAQLADLLIVGSDCKVGGDWRNEVDPQRVKELVHRLQGR